MRKRKGIYQAIDPRGNVTADERWQAWLGQDGCRQLDSEITRIAPFPEPRIESLTVQLDEWLRWRSLAIYTRSGAREAGASFPNGEVRLCWRDDAGAGEQAFSWQADCEIDYNSPLFNMVTIWRCALVAGESRSVDAIQLDAETFRPRRARHTYFHQGTEQCATRFGALQLDHYEVASSGAGSSHFWCDSDGVIYDFISVDGSGFRLIAANSPV
jgi:hypothetical protein